jgi:hypothetical protein
MHLYRSTYLYYPLYVFMSVDSKDIWSRQMLVRLRTKYYNKRDYFNFPIIIFPFVYRTFQQRLHMKYISLSWYGIPEVITFVIRTYHCSSVTHILRIGECQSNSPFFKNNGAEAPKGPRPIVFKEWRDTRTFSNLKSTHCTLLIVKVCVYTYAFWLSLWKIVQSSVILLLPLFHIATNKLFDILKLEDVFRAT